MKRTRTLALTLAAATVVAGGVATQGMAAKAPAPAPKTLSNPELTCQQLIGRFFNNLNPGRTAQLTAFLARSFIIYRADGTHATKAQYLANYPTYTPWGIKVGDGDYDSPTLTCRVHNWLNAAPTSVTPALYTFAWIRGSWRMTSFAKFANVPPTAIDN